MRRQTTLTSAMDHQTPDEMKSSRKMSIKDSAMFNTPERKLN